MTKFLLNTPMIIIKLKNICGSNLIQHGELPRILRGRLYGNKNQNFKNMKQLGVLLIAVLLAFSCNNESGSEKLTSEIVKNPVSGTKSNSDVDMPDITFYGETSDKPQYHDFGVIIQGEVVVHSFKFKNTGNADLIIRSTSSTCGCTVSSYTEKPIPPGGEGKVDVAFSSTNRKGRQNKAVTVLTNAQPASRQLVIEANVVVPN